MDRERARRRHRRDARTHALSVRIRRRLRRSRRRGVRADGRSAGRAGRADASIARPRSTRSTGPPSTRCSSRRTSTRRWRCRGSSASSRRGPTCFAMYDDAGDSLLHVLPGTLGGREPAAGGRRDRGNRSSASGFSRTSLRQHRFRVQHPADTHRRAVRADRQLSLLSSHGRLAEGHEVDHARGVRRAAARRSRRTSSARRSAS